MAKKGRTWERNWIPSDSSTKQRHNYYTKSRIDKTQQNSKRRLCGDRNEKIPHNISEYSKLVQKEYKTRYNRVRKVIDWELCKNLKFDHSSKWYMHKSENFKKMRHTKFLGILKSSNFGQTTRPSDSQPKQSTCRIMNFAPPADHRIKQKGKREKRDEY